MNAPLIECVPNFSEGRDKAVIKQITDVIEAVEGVKLLDVDPGAATNRTVVTFVGEPGPVCEAAFRAVRRASELIDMRKHKGEHPRMGATDVCPLVPVANISMEETVEHARQLGRRIGDELGISVYLYEYAATSEQRRNLADCRAGEYEAMAEKVRTPEWKPDCGPDKLNERAGVTAVGARDFLVAYNVNLNTTSTRRAHDVILDIREKGRVKRTGDPETGEIVRDANGEMIHVPGSLKCVKGIGWFIEEYGVAQISMNLTNLNVTPVHAAFEACRENAARKGLRATGSELVGLIPLKSMLDAGRYFLKKQRRSTGVSDAELIKIAVKSMGLDELYAFKPEEKIIEYAMAAGGPKRLADMSVKAFVEETASESPAPGGGSISAAMGAMGAALATMVANLSSHKKGWDDRWEAFSDWAERGKRCCDELNRLIDADTDAFNAIMSAMQMPKGSDAEKAARLAAIQDATKGAIDVPLRVMRVALESMDVARAMASEGLPASVSDAGVAALAARSAVMGAFLNVKINTGGLTDKIAVDEYLRRGQAMQDKAIATEKAILDIVNGKM